MSPDRTLQTTEGRRSGQAGRRHLDSGRSIPCSPLLRGLHKKRGLLIARPRHRKLGREHYQTNGMTSERLPPFGVSDFNTMKPPVGP